MEVSYQYMKSCFNYEQISIVLGGVNHHIICHNSSSVLTVYNYFFKYFYDPYQHFEVFQCFVVLRLARQLFEQTVSLISGIVQKLNISNVRYL